MASTDLTLIRFNCSAKSHHVVTIGPEEGGDTTCLERDAFMTLRTAEKVQKIIRTQLTLELVVEERDI